MSALLSLWDCIEGGIALCRVTLLEVCQGLHCVDGKCEVIVPSQGLPGLKRLVVVLVEVELRGEKGLGLSAQRLTFTRVGIEDAGK